MNAQIAAMTADKMKLDEMDKVIELIAAYLVEYTKGNKQKTWYYNCPLNYESEGLPLTTLNENGFLTSQSQPGLLYEGKFSCTFYENGTSMKQLPFCTGWLRNDLIKEFETNFNYNFRIVDGDGNTGIVPVTWIDDYEITWVPNNKGRFLHFDKESYDEFFNLTDLTDFESFTQYAESKYTQVEIWGNCPEDNDDFWRALVKKCKIQDK